MHSGRTQQLLLHPPTHTLLSPYSLYTLEPADTLMRMCVCGWATLSNTPQGGQRVARLHSGTSFSHLHSRCVGLLTHCPVSLWECFCWGNSILSLPSIVQLSLLWVCHLFCSLSYFSTPRCSSIAWNTCEQFVRRLRSSRMSLVGGRIYNHKTIRDLRWIYRHKVDILFLSHFVEQILSAQGYACECRETTQNTVGLSHPAFELKYITNQMSD